MQPNLKCNRGGVEKGLLQIQYSANVCIFLARNFIAGGYNFYGIVIPRRKSCVYYHFCK